MEKTLTEKVENLVRWRNFAQKKNIERKKNVRFLDQAINRQYQPLE